MTTYFIFHITRLMPLLAAMVCFAGRQHSSAADLHPAEWAQGVWEEIAFPEKKNPVTLLFEDSGMLSNWSGREEAKAPFSIITLTKELRVKFSAQSAAPGSGNTKPPAQKLDEPNILVTYIADGEIYYRFGLADTERAPEIGQILETGGGYSKSPQEAWGQFNSSKRNRFKRVRLLDKSAQTKAGFSLATATESDFSKVRDAMKPHLDSVTMKNLAGQWKDAGRRSSFQEEWQTREGTGASVSVESDGTMLTYGQNKSIGMVLYTLKAPDIAFLYELMHRRLPRTDGEALPPAPTHLCLILNDARWDCCFVRVEAPFLILGGDGNSMIEAFVEYSGKYGGRQERMQFGLQ